MFFAGTAFGQAIARFPLRIPFIHGLPAVLPCMTIAAGMPQPDTLAKLLFPLIQKSAQKHQTKSQLYFCWNHPFCSFSEVSHLTLMSCREEFQCCGSRPDPPHSGPACNPALTIAAVERGSWTWTILNLKTPTHASWLFVYNQGPANAGARALLTGSKTATQVKELEFLTLSHVPHQHHAYISVWLSLGTGTRGCP